MVGHPAQKVPGIDNVLTMWCDEVGDRGREFECSIGIRTSKSQTRPTSSGELAVSVLSMGRNATKVGIMAGAIVHHFDPH